MNIELEMLKLPTLWRENEKDEIRAGFPDQLLIYKTSWLAIIQRNEIISTMDFQTSNG